MIPEPLLQVLSFPAAFLAGLAVKAAFYALPPVNRAWHSWTSAESTTSESNADYLLTVLLSLPMSGAAALWVNLGGDQSTFIVPALLPLVFLLPGSFEGRSYLKRLKHWKLELLRGTGIATSMIAALYAAQAVLRFG